MNEIQERQRLDKYLRKMAPPKEIPICKQIIGSEEVRRVMGLSTMALQMRIRRGQFPPPLKGRKPQAGVDYHSWRRLSARWPAGLVMACASGVIPWASKSCEEWDELIDDWRESIMQLAFPPQYEGVRK